MKNFVLLGATGSIGTQTLDVARAHPKRLNPLALSAHSNWKDLFKQAQQFRPKFVVLTDVAIRPNVDASLLPGDVELLWGDEGVQRVVQDPRTNVVLAAMVGAAGLRGTVQALQAGKDVALANKESLVVGGPIVTQLANQSGCKLLPVDSEHSAIFQCLQSARPNQVERIVLTASGGPFRNRPIESFRDITPTQALEHPTWNMGPKITIDSATMMNKALEVIEAHWLFGFPADRIQVVIHPQSIVHSMVEFVDGSVLAQVSPPDMRLPIQYALTFPERLPGPTNKLDWTALGSWQFESPQTERYPALKLGFDVVRRAGTSGAALNAANEVAVQRFLSGEIRFTDIVPICQNVLDRHPYNASPNLDDLNDVDRWARQEAGSWQ